MAEENLTTNKENISEESENGNIDGSSSFVKGIRTLENDIANYTKEKTFPFLILLPKKQRCEDLVLKIRKWREVFSPNTKKYRGYHYCPYCFGGGYWGVTNFYQKKYSDAYFNARQNKRRTDFDRPQD